MSDTRQEAAQSLEDALGESLSSSFNPAPAPTRPQTAQDVGTTQAAESVAVEEETESTPVPGMDEWKSTYDSYVEHWQAESAVARDKADKNRKFYEDEADAEAKSKQDAATAAKKREAQEKKDREGAERLRKELAGGVGKGKKGKKAREEEERAEREKKVKEAWELVKGAEPKREEGVVHAGDARGVMDEDHRAGQAVLEGQRKERVAQAAYDPTTSIEPLPPSMQSSSATSPSANIASSQTLSRASASTSQAWEEVSATPSSAEDLSPPPSSSSGNGAGNDRADRDHPIASSSDAQPQSHSLVPTSSSGKASPNDPPARPPSLTLSLFTSPNSLSVSRIFAVLGINLVLPFINGVMLGFGEIFAREAFKVGRMVFRGERSLFGYGRRDDVERGSSGRGVASVGLSGSGGFP